jgi:hypothetical protein
MKTSEQLPNATPTETTDSLDGDPRGPVPALCPPLGEHSPARPSTSAVSGGEREALTSFRATWVIDVDATDAAAAARKARDFQLRPDAEVGVFEVTDGQGRGAKIDLDEDEQQQLATRFPFWIESVRPIEDEAALLATVYIFGVLHHAWFVEVLEDDGDQVAVDDPHGRLDEFHALDADAGRMQTVQVPGYPGEYVLVIYPAGD